MPVTKNTTTNGQSLNAGVAPPSKSRSKYQLSILAGLRAKQLMRGALPRVEADLRRRRNTSIAIEEVRQGRITFTTTAVPEATVGIVSPARDTFPAPAFEPAPSVITLGHLLERKNEYGNR